MTATKVYNLATSRQSAPTILIADDLEENRSLYADMLQDRGYRTVEAADGYQALEILQTQPVDLAVLDISMPKLSGLEICHLIKSNPETCLTPVILVTGMGGPNGRIHGIEHGADDYLTKPVNRRELLARISSLMRIKRLTGELEKAESVLFSLARSIEAKDQCTRGHCDRLSEYAVALGERIGLEEEQLVALRRGGIVHDIGKVAVPEHILLKPGPLTPEERRIMERHTVIGEEICSPLKSFSSVLPIIRHHHERLDGSGYPDGLTGERIPLLARILSVVDVYDALTTDRPYRQALSREDAFAEIWKEVRNGWWDGSLVEAFESLQIQPR